MQHRLCFYRNRHEIRCGPLKNYISENFGKFIVSENVDKFICIARKEVDDIVICYKTQSNGLKAFSLRQVISDLLIFNSLDN